MRILLINTFCGVTSTGRICMDLAQAYEKEGNEVRIAYGRDDKGVLDQCAEYSLRIGTNMDVKLHGLKTRIFDAHGFGSTRATRTFLKWVDEFKPDVVHLHNLHGYYINIRLLFEYLKKHDIPTVWTLHDCWPMTGHCSYFSAVGCERWQSSCYDCPQKKAYPSSSCFDCSRENYQRKSKLFTGMESMTIVTPSAWLASIVQQSYLRVYPTEVIHNGIDTTVFQPTESDVRVHFGLEGRKIALGVASGWGERKGLSYLKRMSRDLPENWKVVIIGLTDEQLADIPSNMIGIKRTNNAYELAAWYTAADVFVNPTLEDNYPTTNLEAQACQTPVVTFNSDGAPETVMDGGGIVVERENYDALLKATLEAAELKGRLEMVSVKDKRFVGGEYLALFSKMLL